LAGAPHRVDQLTLDQRPAVRGATQLHQHRLVPVLLDRVVLLEPRRQLVGAGEKFIDGPWHPHHLRKRWWEQGSAS
jgi:hypothetical protein